MFEIHKGAFFSNHKYQLKTKKTFDSKKVSKKEVAKLQVAEILWLNVQRRIPDMKYNKAKWVGPCKIVSMSRGGLFELSCKVNNKFLSMIVYTHNSLRGFMVNLYNCKLKSNSKSRFLSSVVDVTFV